MIELNIQTYMDRRNVVMALIDNGYIVREEKCGKYPNETYWIIAEMKGDSSMRLIDQINDLRKYADMMSTWNDAASKVCIKAMREAADTIERLNADNNNIKAEILELAGAHAKDNMISLTDLGGVLYDVYRAHTRGEEGQHDS